MQKPRFLGVIGGLDGTIYFVSIHSTPFHNTSQHAVFELIIMFFAFLQFISF